MVEQAADPPGRAGAIDPRQFLVVRAGAPVLRGPRDDQERSEQIVGQIARGVEDFLQVVAAYREFMQQR